MGTVRLESDHTSFEGPDCSGKSTLIGNLYKSSNFRWNFLDRFFLSTICYARQFGRDQDAARERLKRDLTNLNNKIVVVLPSVETLKARIASRGDDIQDENSIVSLREIFLDETNKIRHMPNVLVIEEDLDQTSLVEKCKTWLESFDKVTPEEIGRQIKDCVLALEEDLTIDARVSFSAYEDFTGILSDPNEGDYYISVLRKFIENKQNYFLSDSRISSVQFLPRGKKLQVFATLMRTDVEAHAVSDFKFLCHLSCLSSLRMDSSNREIELFVRFNCAHI